MSTIHHALVLNLHQPAGNLEELLDDREWEAREIVLAMDRIPRSLWPYEGTAKVHLALSGTLLETLSSPGFQERVHGWAKCGDLLWSLQNERCVKILGGAYYHPVLPLIPPEDREEHLLRWLGLGRHLFWRWRFDGFWPPEMGFCMEMIPLLRRLGYRYVLVDGEHVEPLEPMRWEEVRYRPHLAEYGGEEIVVVARDRDLSNAQQSGMDAEWFVKEARERTKFCSFPPLVTTCSDGENGGWFRNVSERSNFWGAFYQPLLEARARGGPVRPVFIDDYLAEHGASGRVRVREGAWNTGWHHGAGFVQWTGSQPQKDALRRVAETSGAARTLRQRAESLGGRGARARDLVEEARWRLLRAQTSCNFFWGEDWVGRCHRDLDEAAGRLAEAEAALAAA